MAYPVTAEIDTYGMSDGEDSMGMQVHPPQKKKVRPLFQIKSLKPLLYFFPGGNILGPPSSFLFPPPMGIPLGG